MILGLQDQLKNLTCRYHCFTYQTSSYLNVRRKASQSLLRVFHRPTREKVNHLLTRQDLVFNSLFVWDLLKGQLNFNCYLANLFLVSYQSLHYLLLLILLPLLSNLNCLSSNCVLNHHYRCQNNLLLQYQPIFHRSTNLVFSCAIGELYLNEILILSLQMVHPKRVRKSFKISAVQIMHQQIRYSVLDPITRELLCHKRW